MSTPNKRLITQYIKTLLEGVSVAAGYKTDVQKVEILTKTWNQAPASVRPYIGIVVGSTTFAYQPAGTIRCTLTMHLLCHVNGPTRDNFEEILDNLEDDIIAVFGSDTRLGGNATMTTVTSIETDESAPSGGASMNVALEVVYFRTKDST